MAGERSNHLQLQRSFREYADPPDSRFRMLSDLYSDDYVDSLRYARVYKGEWKPTSEKLVEVNGIFVPIKTVEGLERKLID